jgi:hypothetical protein
MISEPPLRNAAGMVCAVSLCGVPFGVERSGRIASSSCQLWSDGLNRAVAAYTTTTRRNKRGTAPLQRSASHDSTEGIRLSTAGSCSINSDWEWALSARASVAMPDALPIQTAAKAHRHNRDRASLAITSVHPCAGRRRADHAC